MGRNPPRVCGVKALQAIKENAIPNRAKLSVKADNPHPSKKRSSSPTDQPIPNAKRSALGDVTNNALSKKAPLLKPVTKQPQPHSRKLRSSHPPSSSSSSSSSIAVSSQQSSGGASSSSASQNSSLESASGDTPVTVVKNFLEAASLSDVSLRSEEEDEEDVAEVHSNAEEKATVADSSPEEGAKWTDIDLAESNDPLFSSEYAPEIYAYMREREAQFTVLPYMHQQKDISPSMRTILVDWLIEVQENFELFHETLYLCVRLVDLYLSKKDVQREFLQLVGATCMLIAAKFEELMPPLVDDFLYLCDDAYTKENILVMERDVLRVVGYDINIPVTYRFIRRLARAASASMELHLMARYISESTLQDYQFVDVKPSLMAAACMYLALRMKKQGGWTVTLQHYAGYSLDDILPLVGRLNSMLLSPLLTQTRTVRNKYSHEVFFKVALTLPLVDVIEDARTAVSKTAADSSALTPHTLTP